MTESPPPDGEAVLIERARRGDAGAFRRLVRRHHAEMYRWALALTGSPDDADDVEQAALLRLYRGLHGYDGRGRFSSWMYSIVRSAAADFFRSQKRGERLSGDPGGPPAVAHPNATPDSVDRARLTELVLSLYRELPEQQRAIFGLVDLQGYSPTEVARTMGIKAVTVRTHLHRARSALRRRIIESHPELVEGLGT